MNHSRLYLVLFILLVITAPASAIPTITCHCFTDRSYDPAHPAAADPYFLAATQNSFFAAAFGVDKKTIVIHKQQGVSADNLWIAYWLAVRSGSNPESLLQERQTRGSWRQVTTRLAIPAKSMGVKFTYALKNMAGDEWLAAAVVDELLLRLRFHGETELTALRKAGAGNQELILAGLIAAKTHLPAIRLYRNIKGGGMSWGTLLTRARIDPTQIQSEVDAMVMSADHGAK